MLDEILQSLQSFHVMKIKDTAKDFLGYDNDCKVKVWKMIKLWTGGDVLVQMLFGEEDDLLALQS